MERASFVPSEKEVFRKSVLEPLPMDRGNVFQYGGGSGPPERMESLRRKKTAILIAALSGAALFILGALFFLESPRCRRT